MKRVWISVLIALALAASAAFVACGGEEEEDEGAAAPTATTEAAAPTDEDTEEAVVDEEEEAEEEGDGGGAVSIGDVPVYPGANEVQSGQWSGSEAGLPMMGAPVSAEEYGTIEFAIYETDDSAGDVFDFYKDEMGDWEELWSFSGGAEGEGAMAMGIWTKDEGESAAWVVVTEEDGGTSLMIAVGS